MRLWIALGVVCGATAPASARPEAQADLTMQASYLNVDDRAVADDLGHEITVGTSLRGGLGGTVIYECAGLDFELGGGVPGAFVYDANLYVIGLGLRLPKIGMLRVCAGGGLSGVADRVKFSLQAPVEATLVIHAGSRVRLHAWARASWLAADVRHDGSDAVDSWDELSAGVALGLTESSEFRYERAVSSTGYYLAFRYGEALGTRLLGVAVGYRIDAGSTF